MKNLDNQRLILSFPCGDGYTFSYDAYLPVVFSSKEEFLITLEDTVKKIHTQWLKYQEDILKHHEHSLKILALDSKKEGNLEKIKDHLAKGKELSEAQRKIENFELGGHKLQFEDFVDLQTYRDSQGKDKTFRFITPTVQTIDEFFYYVELNQNKDNNNNNNNKKNKP